MEKTDLIKMMKELFSDGTATINVYSTMRTNGYQEYPVIVTQIFIEGEKVSESITFND